MGGTKVRRPAPIRVLLTGFERFGPFRRNPTEDIVRSYGAKRLALPGQIKANITKVVLPVHTDVFKFLDRRIKGRNYDLILQIGLHSKARTVRVECLARNCMYFRAPDNRGNLIKGKRISQHGPPYLRSRLPFKAIANELRKAKITFGLSDNAGSYICNLLFYQSLQKFKGKSTRVGFIHIPQTRFCPIKKSRRALDIILETCIKAIAENR